MSKLTEKDLKLFVKQFVALKSGKHYNLERFGNDEAALAYSRGSDPIKETT